QHDRGESDLVEQRLGRRDARKARGADPHGGRRPEDGGEHAADVAEQGRAARGEKSLRGRHHHAGEPEEHAKPLHGTETIAGNEPCIRSDTSGAVSLIATCWNPHATQSSTMTPNAVASSGLRSVMLAVSTKALTS